MDKGIKNDEEDYYVEYNPEEYKYANAIQVPTRDKSNALNSNVDDISAIKAYEHLKQNIDETGKAAILKKAGQKNQSLFNPIDKFNMIKKEIDLIENDIAFYKEHPEAFKSEVPLESCLDELKKLKIISNYITNSDNYALVQQIKAKTNLDKSDYSSLNKKIYEKLNEHLLNRIQLINKLKGDNPALYKNIQYELFLTPDTAKVKQLTKMLEIKRAITAIENKIGDWNLEERKKTIAETVENINSHLRMFDKNFHDQTLKKIDRLKRRIIELQKNSEPYNPKDIEKIEELNSGFSSSKDVEDIIFTTIQKMETLKGNHEESAFISLKLKQLLDQQEKIGVSIQENNQVLDKLKENIIVNASVIQKNIEMIKLKMKDKK